MRSTTLSNTIFAKRTITHAILVDLNLYRPRVLTCVDFILNWEKATRNESSPSSVRVSYYPNPDASSHEEYGNKTQLRYLEFIEFHFSTFNGILLDVFEVGKKDTHIEGYLFLEQDLRNKDKRFTEKDLLIAIKRNEEIDEYM